ncbi:CAF17-like 4Fe-4S cluster assembly/insertion protein YgfZ [Yunchengibacter salinarum]|uniref:CAF17-like 4Fe-4S cluster assembly/insertion protein YgfZ n=1 Tax=Yunchengibacter salinarum TaxID=3133399 RepID=UPI0035B61600
MTDPDAAPTHPVTDDPMTGATRLDHRGVIALGGSERVSFLQGLVTNDVTRAAPGQAVYAAMLTPQGKLLHDMLIFADADRLLLDVERDRMDALVKRLTMYKLRADVSVTPLDSLTVWQVLDTGGNLPANALPDAAIASPDPRHHALGHRALLPAGSAPDAPGLPLEQLDETRVRLGVPDGSRDMAVEKDFWLETGAERLNGVDFHKGCYVGQELTARMKYRTELKKTLMPVRLEGSAEPGTDIHNADGKAAGTLRFVAGGVGLALLRFDRLSGALTAGDATVYAQKEIAPG